MLSLRELERAAGILRRTARGHRVQAVSQPDATRVALELYAGGEGAAGRHVLLLVCDAEGARVGAPAEVPRSAPGAPHLAQYLRAHLRGARLADAEILDGDRQLALRFESGEGAQTLLLAIFGRKSNVLVLDAEQRVRMALRPLADTRPELSLGQPWQPPSRSLPTAGEDRFADTDDADYLAAIEAHYAARESAGAADDARRRVEAALRKEAKSLDRKLGKLERELADAEAASRLERQGELLKSALDRVKRGDREVLVRDWDGGAEVRIELDPLLGPAENLERIFKRYRKGVRALSKASAQHAAVRAARDELAALEAELAGLSDDALAGFAGRPAVARLVSRFAPPPAASPAAARRASSGEALIGGRKIPARLVPRRYRSAGGLEIWVGRSDAANDYLTTRLARGKDLFFHVAATPGSHVILRTEGRDDPPSEAILDACELAAHYSKARKASRVDVHVVPIRNVRKPKGAKPGLVEVHGGKNVHLRREEARLRRVLDARIDEPAGDS